MDNLEYIEKKLAGHYWAGDFEMAKKLGNELLANAIEKKKSHRFALPLMCSLAVVLTVAISISLAVYYSSPKDTPSFSYGDDGTVFYLTGLASHYYPDSVASLQKDDRIYGNVYYAYNDKNDGYIAFRIYQGAVSSLLVKDENGLTLLSSDAKFSNYHVSTSLVTFYPTIVDNESKEVSFGKISLDLTEYSN